MIDDTAGGFVPTDGKAPAAPVVGMTEYWVRPSWQIAHADFLPYPTFPPDNTDNLARAGGSQAAVPRGAVLAQAEP
jgi:hypothetical protein